MDTRRINDALAKWLSERTQRGYQCTNSHLWRADAVCLTERRMWLKIGEVFTEDLNSMALIEGAMNPLELSIYRNRLVRMFEEEDAEYAIGNGYQAAKQAITATPAQRAEAACHALGLWCESEDS